MLALLTLFGVSFARLMNLERSASKNFMDGVQARLAAQAGLARAEAELERALAAKPYTDPRRDTWIYADNDPTLPLEEATDAQLSFAGQIGSSGTGERTEYRVRVLDCQGQLNVNDQIEVLPALLDRLGTAIQRARGVADPVRGRGRSIIQARDALPGQRFGSKSALARTLRDILGDEATETVSCYLTVDSWRDPDAVVAVPPSSPDDCAALAALAPQPRAPLTVNTAPIELLAACFEGIAGRISLVVSTELASARINDRTEMPWSDYSEETRYQASPFAVFVGPISPDTAWRIAGAVVAERPFATRRVFEAWLRDRAQPEEWFSSLPVEAPPAITDVDFDSASFRANAGASLLAANADPKGVISAWNASQTLTRRPGKADLYSEDGDITQSLDLCFGALGRFEITSLGRVRDGAGLLVVEARIRSTVSLLRLVRLSTQRDLEAATVEQLNTLSFPDHIAIALNPEGADTAGWLQLAPFSRSADPLAETGALETRAGGAPRLTFEARFETRKGTGRANLRADVHGPAATGAARGSLADAEEVVSTVSEGSCLLPDGVLSDSFRSRYLRYRAACSRDDDSQGESQAGGNVGLLRGGLEFWYKPDYDWSAGGLPTPVVCGLLFAGHAQTNPFASPSERTSGCQMFLFRNTSGDLRLIRLYYEVVGRDGDEHPLVRDPVDGSWIEVEEYVRRAERDVTVTVETREVVESSTIVTRTTTTRRYGLRYPWPPAEIPVDPVIRFSRREVVVPYDVLRSWHASEWHHLALTWDDGDASPGGLVVYADGRRSSSSPYVLPGLPNEQVFCELNQPLGANLDCLYIGGIERRQLAASGAFKFERWVRQPARGTIDDVRCFDGAEGFAVVEPERFPQRGSRSFSFQVPEALSGEARVAYVSADAALPSRFGVVGGEVLRAPQGSGAVELSAEVRSGTGVRWSGRSRWEAETSPCAVSAAKRRWTVKPGESVRVTIALEPADFGLGFNLDTPVVEAVTVALFEPAPRVLETLWRR